jgi:uridylate kinase
MQIFNDYSSIGKRSYYKRVLLKVSGEALMGDQQFGHDSSSIVRIAEDIQEAIRHEVKVCVVVGAGNIYRGAENSLLGVERVTGDYIGMMATVINALILQNVMERLGVNAKVLSAIPILGVCETYNHSEAKKYMDKKQGRVVIFAAGTGNPLCTTDSASVLRAIEMNCDLLLKGTKVDGVYDSDPEKNPDAKKYSTISYDQILKANLQIMDIAAVAMAKEHKLPIKVFSIKQKGAFEQILRGEGEAICTTIQQE